MIPEQAGVNNAQSAVAQGASAQPAIGTGVIAQVAAGQGAISQPATEPQTVPYDRFKEVNERMKAAEEQSRNLQQQFMIMQASMQQKEAAERGGTQQQGAGNILAELGIPEDEPYIPAQAVPKILKAIDDRMANTVNRIIGTVQTQQVMTEMPDYGEAVGTIGLMNEFQASPHLEKALRKSQNQHIARLIRTSQPSPDIMRLAYETVINDPDYKQFKQRSALSPQQQLNADASTRIQAAQTIMSSSAAGGGQIGRVDSISSMSDEQLRAHRASVINKL